MQSIAEDDISHLFNTPRATVQDLGSAATVQETYPAKAPAPKLPVSTGGEPMNRGLSRSSAGSHKHRATKATARKTRPKLATVIPKSDASELASYASAAAPQLQPGAGAQNSLTSISGWLGNASDYESYSPHFLSGLGPDALDMDAQSLFMGSTLDLSGDMAHQHVDPAQMRLDFDRCLANSPASANWDVLTDVDSHTSSPAASDRLSASMFGSSPETAESSPVLSGASPV